MDIPYTFTTSMNNPRCNCFFMRIKTVRRRFLCEGEPPLLERREPFQKVPVSSPISAGIPVFSDQIPIIFD
jgi:hypothetical protein